MSPHQADRIESMRTMVGGVEITLHSDRGFPVRNELAILRIGSRDFYLSRYPDTGDSHSLIFTLTSSDFDQLRSGDDVTVRYGQSSPPEWQFDVFDKSRLRTE